VAVTGHVENEYVERALQCGIDKIYPKPLPVKEFGQLLIAMKFIDKVPLHLEINSD
jgi:DNA-binding NarL/FixJ family response regulator